MGSHPLKAVGVFLFNDMAKIELGIFCNKPASEFSENDRIHDIVLVLHQKKHGITIEIHNQTTNESEYCFLGYNSVKMLEKVLVALQEH